MMRMLLVAAMLSGWNADNRDMSLVYSSSDGGDTLGDILIELAHEVA